MNDIRPGQLLGKRYSLLERLGAGGFGEVWKATDQSLGRQVALKILAAQKIERGQTAQGLEVVERFKREARILANLKHINILSLFDYGETDGLRYLVMPLHEGGTLEDRLAQSPLTLTEADHYFTQLADALDYAHKEKIVHRDLKPSNALLDHRNNVLLSDFGISRLVEDSAGLTLSGTTIGTPDYMSPEQFKGLIVDHRSDIYALGILLYQMAAGRAPFTAENKWALAQKHLTDFAPRPSTINPQLTADIDDVILKAIAKDPNERYNSAAEFLAAWKVAIGQPEVARSVAPTTLMDTANAPTFWQRYKGVAAISAGALALITVFACVGIFFLMSNSNSDGSGTTIVLPPLGATATSTLPRLTGSAAANGITVQAESAIGAKQIKIIVENKNPINYAVQLSKSSGDAKAAVLQQPSGFKFPLVPEKDFLSLKPNQKESTTLNFDVLLNAGDKLIFQWIAADVGGSLNLALTLTQ